MILAYLGTIGAYWVARTWKWNILGDEQPGGPQDTAYFDYANNDYFLYAQVYSILDGYTHCAGATQGWVWSSSPPSGIYQPTPLRITSSIGQLKSKTNLLWYYHSGAGTWGVLSNIWFKVKNIYDAQTNTVFDGVLGIDFYYACGNQYIYDGFFRRQGDVMVYTKMPLTGTGVTYCDILQALEEAQQKAAQGYLYFDLSNCWLYQAEVLVEGYAQIIGGWTKAKYSYFRVYYFETGSLTGLQLSYSLDSIESQKQDFVDIHRTNNITYSIHKLKDNIKPDNGFYKMTLTTESEYTAVIIDSIKLLAIEKNSNNVTEIPVYLAFSQRLMKYINLILENKDGTTFKLINSDSLEIWFDSSKIPYADYQLFLLVAANII